MDKKRECVSSNVLLEKKLNWETIRRVNKNDKEYLQFVVKRYCGKGLLGKVFRIAYVDTKDGRKWIKQ